MDSIQYEIEEIKKDIEQMSLIQSTSNCVSKMSGKVHLNWVECNRNMAEKNMSRHSITNNIIIQITFKYRNLEILLTISILLQICITIKPTESRQITVCIRFPSNYPSEHLMVELKTLTISGKILDGLTKSYQISWKTTGLCHFFPIHFNLRLIICLILKVKSNSIGILL